MLGSAFSQCIPWNVVINSCPQKRQPCLLLHQVVIFSSVAHYVSFNLLVQYILSCLEIKQQTFSSDIWTHLALQLFSCG